MTLLQVPGQLQPKHRSYTGAPVLARQGLSSPRQASKGVTEIKEDETNEEEHEESKRSRKKQKSLSPYRKTAEEVEERFKRLYP